MRTTDFEIVFRRLDAPVPWWTVPGARWQVEYWCDEMAHPVGLAWVFVVEPPPGGENYTQPYLDWITVEEPYRRRGVGTAILEAVKARGWQLRADGVTPSGEAFVKAAAGRGLCAADENEDDDREVDL